MPLAPEIAVVLERMRGQPQMHQTPLAQLRQTRPRMQAQGLHPVGQVLEASLPGPGGPLAYRLYSPSQDSGTLGLVVLLHGGGFVFGSVDGYYDHVARVLCQDTPCRVLSLDYRLAPENKFPAASDDALSAQRRACASTPIVSLSPAEAPAPIWQRSPPCATAMNSALRYAASCCGIRWSTTTARLQTPA